jgi:hypothetical protein
MAKAIKIKTIGKYNGHSFKNNGAVDLKLKFGYDELIHYYMQLPLLRSENTRVLAKVEDGEPFNLGTFMFRSYSMDHDGEGTITFGSIYDSVEADNLNALVADKDKMVQFMFKAEVEDVEEDEEG